MIPWVVFSVMTYRFSSLPEKYYKLFYLFSKKNSMVMDSETNKKHTKAKSIYDIDGSSYSPMFEQPQQFNKRLMKAAKSVR